MTTHAAWRGATAQDWIVPEWPAPDNVRTLITTRNGGVSSGVYSSLNLGAGSGDADDAVAANRARLRQLLPAEPVWLKQVHGVAVADLDRAADAAVGEVEADASVARQKNRVCVVMMADCLPVLLADDAGTVVAAAHAGWRGLCAGVIEGTVRAMNVAPASLSAYLGPCIGAAVYEVGGEVRDAYLAVDQSASAAFSAIASGKWLADLPMLARQRLQRMGLQAGRVYGGGYCTLSDRERFFSYRRDGASGRMAALIWRV